jgi:hypothetical protein
MTYLKNYFLAIFFFVVCSIVLGQNTDTIKGVFEYNQILNGYSELTTQQKKQYTEYISKIDTALLNRYFETISSGLYILSLNDSIVNWDSLSKIENKKYEIADSLLATDSILKGTEARMIAMIYTSYHINKLGLQEYYVICQTDEAYDSTINVFLTKKQLKNIKKRLGKNIELKVRFIAEIKWTKFRIYVLDE